MKLPYDNKLISQQDKQILKDAIGLCQDVLKKYSFQDSGLSDVYDTLFRAGKAVELLQTGRRI